MIDFSQVKNDAIGRWPGIFAQMGIDVGNGKHQACPVCGGEDRFRFDDKDGRGTWFCNQCGAGDGVKLVQRVLNTDFAGALGHIAGIVGHVPAGPVKSKSLDVGRIRKMLRQLWNDSIDLTGTDPVSKYLRSRGLMMAVNDVRFCSGCYEAETKSKMPAMVAVIRNPSGKPVSIHRTYLDGPCKARIKSPKKMMPRIEPLAGCAIRLFGVSDTVGIAEGIETAIAANQLTGVPTWAAVSSTIMEAFVPPDGVRHVVVFGDHDANYTGQAAAFKLAKKLYLKDYLVEVEIPEYGDWADQVGKNFDE